MIARSMEASLIGNVRNKKPNVRTEECSFYGSEGARTSYRKAKQELTNAIITLTLTLGVIRAILSEPRR